MARKVPNAVFSPLQSVHNSIVCFDLVWSESRCNRRPNFQKKFLVWSFHDCTAVANTIIEQFGIIKIELKHCLKSIKLKKTWKHFSALLYSSWLWIRFLSECLRSLREIVWVRSDCATVISPYSKLTVPSNSSNISISRETGYSENILSTIFYGDAKKKQTAKLRIFLPDCKKN